MYQVRMAGTFACRLLLVVLGSLPFHAHADDEETPTQLPPVEVKGTPPGEYHLALDQVFSLLGMSSFAKASLPTLPIEQVIEDQDVEACDELRGNPVRLPSGLKVEEETDFATDGEMGLFLTRTYGQLDGLFGDRWRSNFDYSLESDGAGGIRAHRPNGDVIWLQSMPGGWRQSTDKPLPRIQQAPDGLFTLFNEAGGTEVYDGSGRIHIVRNEQGIGWYYAYAGHELQRVTHTSGRTVQFSWTNNELRQVTDPAGSVYRYAYHRVGHNERRLADVTLPGTPATTIIYDYMPSPWTGYALGGLTGKAFDGLRYSTFVYDANSEEARVLSTEHAGGVEKYSFAYHGYPSGTTEPYTIVETNPLGHKTSRRYLDGRLVSVEGLASPNCARSFRALQYDAKGQPDRVTDFAGYGTEFDYDAAGRLVRKVEAAGTAFARTRTYAWAPDHNRVVRTALQGVNETAHTYTADGRLASSTITDVATGAKRTTTYAYTTHASGMLASMVVEGPATGDKRTHLYSTQGNLLEVRNAAGHATKYTGHNGRGQPGRIVDPAGAATEYVYDARGRVLVERTFPNGTAVETRYVYGASGLLDAMHNADGSTAIYHYDAARRLIQEDRTEPDGTFAVRRITYNFMSQPTRIEVGRD